MVRKSIVAQSMQVSGSRRRGGESSKAEARLTAKTKPKTKIKTKGTRGSTKAPARFQLRHRCQTCGQVFKCSKTPSRPCLCPKCGDAPNHPRTVGELEKVLSSDERDGLPEPTLFEARELIALAARALKRCGGGEYTDNAAGCLDAIRYALMSPARASVARKMREFPRSLFKLVGQEGLPLTKAMGSPTESRGQVGGLARYDASCPSLSGYLHLPLRFRRVTINAHSKRIGGK